MSYKAIIGNREWPRVALQNPPIPFPAENSSDNPPAPAAGLTGGDLARLRRSLDSSVSDNTRAAYNSVWRSFNAWAQSRGALEMPASPPLVVAYLVPLYHPGVQAGPDHIAVARERLDYISFLADHYGNNPASASLLASFMRDTITARDADVYLQRARVTCDTG